MANMSIDDMFLRDPRVAQLARALGWSKYEARGRLLDVFAIVYDRAHSGRGHFLNADDIDTAADFPGLAERLLEFDLAVKQDAEDGEALRIRGSSKRTGYLKAKVSAGRKGGRKSGESRRNSALKQTKQLLADQRSTNEPKSTLPNPTQIKDDVAPQAALTLDSPGLQTLKAKVDRAAASPIAGYAETVADFTARFVAAHDGSKPTWNEKTGAQLKRLLRDHGEVEVRKRIAVLFESAPPWLKGRDFGTLQSQFDKLVPASTQQLPTRTIPEL